MSNTYRKTSYYGINDDEIKIKIVDKKHGFAVVPDGKAKGKVVDEESGIVFETQNQKKIAKRRFIKKARVFGKNIKENENMTDDF